MVIEIKMLNMYYPKSIKFSSWTTAPPCPRFDHSTISSFTSLPKSSWSLIKSSLVPRQTPDHSLVGGVALLEGNAFAFLLGQSLGDLLPTTLDETLGVWSNAPELRPVPTPTVIAGYPESALLKFGMVKVLAWSLQSVLNVSGERKEKNTVNRLSLC